MATLIEKLNSRRKEYSLGDISSFRYGKMPRDVQQQGKYPIFSGYRVVGYTDTEYNSDENLIIVARGVGGTGDVKISPSKSYITNLSIIADLDNSIVDKKYLFYRFQLNNLKFLDSGSAQSQITIQDLNFLKIVLPDLPTQRKIAEILSAYDAKIENNNFIIKKLEATAQTLFDEWFVNLRFPGHEKVKFVDSEIREIPEGWEVKPLDQIADFLNGVASQKYPAINAKESLPVIKIREMNSGIDQNSDRATREIDKKYIIKNGDILFAWSGSLSLMTWVGGEGVLNQHIFKVTSKNYPKWFIYHWVQRHLQNFKIIAEGKATTMGHIQRHHLNESLVVVPTEPILIKANKVLSNLFDQQILLKEENISLRSQRDQLLVKLI